MKLTHLSIDNYRGFQHLELDLAGESRILLGANGSGKSAILRAASTALGLDRNVEPGDFTDPRAPVEITCTLEQLGPALAGEFVEYVDFAAAGPKLRLGARATLDGPDVEFVCGYPDTGWVAARRSALRALPIVWLSDVRDATRLAALVGRRSVLAPLVAELDLQNELDTAGAAVEQAIAELATANPLEQLFIRMSSHLRSVLAEAPTNVLGLEGLPAADLLRELELFVEYQTFPQPLTRQPSGLKQLAIFSVVLEALTQQPGALVLVDEPETSLHPQAQRALITRLASTDSQALIATHAADVLVRWDLRRVVRLERTPAGTNAHDVQGIDDAQERRLARHVAGGLAEAFFARVVLLVEGPGDRLAVNAFAETLGVDLDAAGASIVDLDGADLFATLYSLLGPAGLGIDVVGLCDEDREQSWADVVLGANTYTGNRASLEQAGVFVLDPDIEGVLVNALGDTRTEQVVASAGLTSRLQAFRLQPAYSGLSASEQLLAFVRHKRNKTVLPPLLALELQTPEIPGPVARLLSGV